MLAALHETLQKSLFTAPTHVHTYAPLNLRTPDTVGVSNENDLSLEFYLDGSHEPPSRNNGWARLSAGCCFLIVANQRINLGQEIEEYGPNKFVVFRRCGLVCTARDWPPWIRALKDSNNVRELSCFLEAMIYFQFEMPVEFQGRAMMFCFDSLLAGNQSS